jgi:glycosyltransferase involved in cell wall biosynthesis
MTARVTISAIMAVRNSVESVAAALDSITAQTRRVDELVIVDGRSTDGTLDVVASYATARVIAQPDDGLAAARNLALASTSGSVVAFLDADDRWEPDKTAVQLALLTDSVAVVAGMMRRVRDGGVTEVVPALTPGGLLIRRRVFDAVGCFDQRYRIASDTDWLIRVREAGLGPVMHSDVVLQKGVRVGSLSRDVGAYRLELLQVAREQARRSAGEPA